MKKQIGCCFNIEGREYIYEGLTNGTGHECNRCGLELKAKAHLFNSVDGYNEGSYESIFYGSECVKTVIQGGFHK